MHTRFRRPGKRALRAASVDPNRSAAVFIAAPVGVAGPGVHGIPAAVIVGTGYGVTGDGVSGDGMTSDGISVTW